MSDFLNQPLAFDLLVNVIRGCKDQRVSPGATVVDCLSFFDELSRSLIESRRSLLASGWKTDLNLQRSLSQKSDRAFSFPDVSRLRLLSLSSSVS